MKIGTAVRTTRRNGQKIKGVVTRNLKSKSGDWVEVKFGDPSKLLKTRESQLKVI